MFDGSKWNDSCLKDVYYVPDLGRTNLFSLGTATRNGFEIRMKGSEIIISKGSKPLLVGYKKEGSDLGTLCIKKNPIIPSAFSCNRVAAVSILKASCSSKTSQEAYRWHLRLGHVPIEKIKMMMTNGLVDGLTLSSVDGFSVKDMLLENKAGSLSCPNLKGKLFQEHVFMLMSAVSQSSLRDFRYFILFKDDASAYRRVFFMKKKSDSLQCLKKYLNEVSSITGWKMKRHRSNNSTEFLNKEYQDFLVEKGIHAEASPTFTPEMKDL